MRVWGGSVELLPVFVTRRFESASEPRAAARESIFDPRRTEHPLVSCIRALRGLGVAQRRTAVGQHVCRLSLCLTWLNDAGSRQNSAVEADMSAMRDYELRGCFGASKKSCRRFGADACASVRRRVERGSGFSSFGSTINGADTDALAGVEDAQSLCGDIQSVNHFSLLCDRAGERTKCEESSQAAPDRHRRTSSIL